MFDRYSEIYHRRTGRTLRRLPPTHGLGRLSCQGERDPDIREFREHDIPHYLIDPPEYDQPPAYTRNENPPEYTPGENPDQFFTYDIIPNIPRINYDMYRIARNYNASLIQRWYRRISNRLLPNQDMRFHDRRPSEEVYLGYYRYKFEYRSMGAYIFYDRKTGKLVPGKIPRTRYGRKNFLRSIKNTRLMNKYEEIFNYHLNIGYLTINNQRLDFNIERYKNNNKPIKGKHVIYYDMIMNRIGITYIEPNHDFTYFPRDHWGQRRNPIWNKRKKFWIGTIEEFGIRPNENITLNVYNPFNIKIGDLNFSPNQIPSDSTYIDLDVWHEPNFEWSYLSTEYTRDLERGLRY